MVPEIKRMFYRLGLIFMLMAISACSANPRTVDLPMPPEWVLTEPVSQAQCAQIDGVYKVDGVGTNSKAPTPASVRLDAAMGHLFPTGLIPREMEIWIKADKSLLKYEFRNPETKAYTAPVQCVNGWYELELFLEDLYLGDGAILDYSKRKIRLTKSADRSLIVHGNLETQFASLKIFKSRDFIAYWSKHEEL